LKKNSFLKSLKNIFRRRLPDEEKKDKTKDKKKKDKFKKE
jgi:hypothetical protein